MKQSLVVALFVSVLGFGFGMTQASDLAPTPGIALEADELQGGSCGDGRCQPPEDCNTCPSDCGTCCGNYRCEPPEDCNSCPQDCPCD